MAPDVKVRDLEPEIYERLRQRAKAHNRSLEAELRLILAEAAAVGGVSAEVWEAAGFDEVDEIVPGRLYEAWANHECYRIAVTRAIVTSSTIRWNSSIDHLFVKDHLGDEDAARAIWTRPFDIAARLLGDTPEMALGDAVRWLAEYAGVSPTARARRATHDDER